MPEDSRPPPSSGTAIRLRKAQASDIDELTELEAKAFASDRLTRQRLRALARSASTCMLVAHRGAALVGYVLVLTRRNSRAARLYSLAVAPAQAGRGIGAILLAAAESAASAGGAEELRLEVRADNAAAIRLYEQHGYRPCGRREDYYEDGAPALRYARDIRNSREDPARSRALGRAA